MEYEESSSFQSKLLIFVFEFKQGSNDYSGTIRRFSQGEKLTRTNLAIPISTTPGTFRQHRFWVSKNYYIHGSLISSCIDSKKSNGRCHEFKDGNSLTTSYSTTLTIMKKGFEIYATQLTKLDQVASIHVSKRHDFVYVRHMYKIDVFMLNQPTLTINITKFDNIIFERSFEISKLEDGGNESLFKIIKT